MTKRKKIDVQIDGRNFTVVGEGSEEHIQKLASYVDEIITEVGAKNAKLSQIMTATLAALHISDELSRSQKELEELKAKAKDPLDKYDDVCMELEEAKEEIKTLENLSEKYQQQITVYDKKREEKENEIESLKEEISKRDKSIEEKDELIKSLQDKNYNNQLEIVDIKKELSEYLKILDDKTSS